MDNAKMINDLLAAEKILRGYKSICRVDEKRIHLLSDMFFQLFPWEDIRIGDRDNQYDCEYYIVIDGVTIFCLERKDFTAVDAWNIRLNATLEGLQETTDEFEKQIKAIMEERPHDDSRVPEAEEAQAD